MKQHRLLPVFSILLTLASSTVSANPLGQDLDPTRSTARSQASSLGARPSQKSEGSGGTRGGGDYEFDIKALLPDSLKIHYVRLLRDYEDAVYMPTLGRAAWELVFDIDFDKNNAAEDDLAASVTAFAKYRKIVEPLEVVDRTPWGLQVRVFDTPDLKHVTDRNYPFNPWSNSNWFASRGQVEIDLNGKHVSVKEAFDEISKIGKAVVQQIDLLDLDTYRVAFEFNKFLYSIGMKGIDDLLEARILGTIRSEIAEMRDMTLKAVTLEGSCDSEMLERLIARLNHWVLGNEIYFKRLENDLRFNVSRGTHDTAVRARKDFRDFISDSIPRSCLDNLDPQQRTTLELVLTKQGAR